MKLRNVNFTLLLLGALIFLSFAFYVSAQEESADTGSATVSAPSPKAASADPAQAADKTAAAPIAGDATDNGNLTEELAQKITALSSESDPNDQQVSLSQIQQMVNGVLDSQNQQITLPKVDMSSIKILPENYSGYSKTTAQKKEKDDVANYLAAVFYIFASNSPQPITSASDTTAVLSQVANQITSAMDSGDTQALDQLSQSGSKILDQLKDVPVPQNLVDIHVKAMQYALYAQSLEKTLKPTTDDPIGEMVNYYKVEALIQSLISFSGDVENALDQYNLNYSDIQDKVKNYGIELPNLPASDTSTSTDSGGSN